MSRQRDGLPRLNIPTPLHLQQPQAYDRGGLYSPALPTSLAHGFHPAMPIPGALQTPMLQTPMQQHFVVQTPQAPFRPTHRSGAASVAHLAAAGIHQPNTFPITPLGGHFPRPSMGGMMGGQGPPSGHPFPGRNRRQLSIGGPPKAVLGGPARKTSPLPPTTEAAATPPVPAIKPKKVIVNLPKETVKGEDGQDDTRASWARNPLPVAGASSWVDSGIELASRIPYPPDSWRYQVPDTIDVFLPGKRAWEAIKQQEIEAKLEQLGVERGSGSNIPHIHAPHARAASISTPADPALLLFKLNKLQSLQSSEPASPSQQSLANSASVSPQPPNNTINFGLPHFPPSPNFSHQQFVPNSSSSPSGIRHGHSMSLAPTRSPSFQQGFGFGFSSNEFASNRNRSPLSIITESAPAAGAGNGNGMLASAVGGLAPPDHLRGIWAPQGRVPVVLKSPEGSVSGARTPKDKPDFARGFGVDIPEEGEEDETEESAKEGEDDGGDEMDSDDGLDSMDEQERLAEEDKENSSPALYEPTATHTRTQSHQSQRGSLEGNLHSRHESRLSAALSMRSFAGLVADGLKERVELLSNAEANPLSQDFSRNFDRDDSEDEEDHVDLATLRKKMQDIRKSQSGIDFGSFENRVAKLKEEPENGLDEWTGSEFVGVSEDDNESIGEWSNPSDEERARQQRVERRLRRRAQQEPRKLPNFPRPPENTTVFSRPADQDGDITNPSEEEAQYVHVPSVSHRHFGGSASVTSGPHSVHDPAHAHSRLPSEAASDQRRSGHVSRNASIGGTFLNPFAKPFVFGGPAPAAAPAPAPAPSSSFVFGAPAPAHTAAPGGVHARMPSFGKPLNIAAQEFKPNFTFKMPTAAPAFPVPEPDLEPASPFKVQGREKRQKTSSIDSLEEGDSFTSFKFPAAAPAPPMPVPQTSNESRLNPTAPPFTFAGFSAAATLPQMTDYSRGLDDSYLDAPTNQAMHGDSTIQPDPEESNSLPAKNKRPVPLDFKRPVSGNTVPAGLFKALATGGSMDGSRRSMRSRLSNNDIYEHSNRPSLDDLNVPGISLSHKVSRQRLVTDPGNRAMSPTDDVFGSPNHRRRRSSLPDNIRPSSVTLSISDGTQEMSEASSIHAATSTNIFHAPLQAQALENMLQRVLEQKLAQFRDDIVRVGGQSGTASLNPRTEATIAEVLSLFRTQLHNSASKGLEESQLAARGDLDLEMVRDIVDQGHVDALESIKEEMTALISQLAVTPDGLDSALGAHGGHNTRAILAAISDLSSRVGSGSHSSGRSQSANVDEIVDALAPILNNIRPEQVDYNFLTEQLSQAVKPHISQLIDLASDKRETAGLIVERILPLLPSLQSATPIMDTEAVTLQLCTEVRRAIAPIDAFEIKEQVADLVVERLDSRLAVRDKTFNVDTVSGKVVEHVLPPVNKLRESLSELLSSQQSLSTQQSQLVSSQTNVAKAVEDLPGKVLSALDELKGVFSRVSQPSAPLDKAPRVDENVLQLKTTVSDVATGQQGLSRQNDELLSLHKEALQKLDVLPDTISSAISAIQASNSSTLSSHDSYKREIDELRKTNTDFQVQVAKARGAHGQVRVEKDMLTDKLGVVEADRVRLRAQVSELETKARTASSELTTVEARNKELEEALSKALARLQATDVASQTDRERIAELERSNRELASDKQSLKSKVDGLELQVTFARRDQTTTEKALDALQKQHDQVVSQQSHWDDLRAASEKLDTLSNLIGQSDNEELRDLRRVKDKHTVLEIEHSTLQKRVKELENKLNTNEKLGATTKHSLNLAQQRSTEWEQRAREHEGQLELTKTELEQLEQTHSQLETDYALARMQLDEKEADGRLAKEREAKSRDQITALEAKLSLLQSQLVAAVDQARAAATKTPTRNSNVNGTSYNGNVNGYSRPESRSTYIVERSPPAPTGGTLWDSMHNPYSSSANGSRNGIQAHTKASPAPRTSTPNRYPNSLSRKQSHFNNVNSSRSSIAPPSPTPSTVSLAPTVDADGWWS